MRSTLAIRIANHYNKKKRKDNWFKNLDKLEAKLLAQLIKERCKNIDIEKTNTFEIFECFYLGDLRKILQEYWNLFGDIFHDKKEYKNQILPSYNKRHLDTKIEQIVAARNEICHNKPTKVKFQKDLEILLLRMEYDFKNIGDISLKKIIL